MAPAKSSSCGQRQAAAPSKNGVGYRICRRRGESECNCLLPFSLSPANCLNPATIKRTARIRDSVKRLCWSHALGPFLEHGLPRMGTDSHGFSCSSLRARSRRAQSNPGLWEHLTEERRTEAYGRSRIPVLRFAFLFPTLYLLRPWACTPRWWRPRQRCLGSRCWDYSRAPFTIVILSAPHGTFAGKNDGCARRTPIAFPRACANRQRRTGAGSRCSCRTSQGSFARPCTHAAGGARWGALRMTWVGVRAVLGLSSYRTSVKRGRKAPALAARRTYVVIPANAGIQCKSRAPKPCPTRLNRRQFA